MVLIQEEQENIRKVVKEQTPEDFEITGKLWTLGRTRQYIQKQFHKAINERTLHSSQLPYTTEDISHKIQSFMR